MILPVSWRAISISLALPSASPLLNGISHAVPGPLNQGTGFPPCSEIHSSTHLLSVLNGLTLTVSGNRSKEPSNQLSGSFLQEDTAFKRRLEEASSDHDFCESTTYVGNSVSESMARMLGFESHSDKQVSSRRKSVNG